MAETTLTLKLKGLEAELLEEMVKLGLFNSKTEAIRAILTKCAVDFGFVSRKDLWKRAKRHRRLRVKPEELENDLHRLEKC